MEETPRILGSVLVAIYLRENSTAGDFYPHTSMT